MVLLSLTLWLSASAAGSALPAALLEQPAERADWQLHSSAFHCRLQQVVSGFGQVSFLVEPGESLRLELSLTKPHYAISQAQVMARPADWRQTASPIAFPYSAELYHDTQVSFIAAALPLLQQVQAGHWLQFELGELNNKQQLLLTSVRGAQAAEQFRGCITKMSPLSWQQARDSEVLFSAGQRTLTQQQLPQLQQLARYLQLDESVSKILIDGHTDDVGTTWANRQLSKERADEVAAQLIGMGVAARTLEVRAHGNRYPLVNSQGKAEQANRRVTIRLVRNGAQPEASPR